MLHAPAKDDCPCEDDIAAFLRGRLTAEHTPALEAHVVHCAACRRLLSMLAQAAAGSRSSADSVSPTLPLEPSTRDAELQPGTRFGRYLVLDLLGAGGMGAVYAAYDPDLNRKVALKVLHDDGGGPADQFPTPDTLLREAQAMAQLAHPNVVTVFEAGTIDGCVFIAMELVEGMTLATWLAAARRARSDIITAFVAAGHGLAAAHAAGLIHRDFKPENVLIGHDGRVRVTDFGLARQAPDPAHRAATAPDRATRAPRTGLAGTLAYMAPEQYRRTAVDARADQFSFAVALYEALCGERPFDPQQLARGRQEPDRRRSAPPRHGLPVALHHVLLRALSAEPDRRYPAMRDLLAALAPPPRRGRAFTVGASVVVAVAVAAAAGHAVHLRRAARQRTELVGRLRGLAPELRTRLLSAHMLPRHDIRPARDEVRRAMQDVERVLQTPEGQDEIALVDLVLGEGYRALGDHDRALSSLEAAWTAGERGPPIEAALGAELGAAYESRLGQIERTTSSRHREAELRAIATRYRDPAMTHLRAALAAGAGSPAYLEALIAFHDRRYADAGRAAHAAFAGSPTFYEAGMLEARAHHQAARALEAADRASEAPAEHTAALQIFERVVAIARSDDEAWLRYAEVLHGVAGGTGRYDPVPELEQQAIAALHTVREINPERWDAVLREADMHESRANREVLWYRDPSRDVDQVLALASEARALGADADQVDGTICRADWERSVHEVRHGIDPHATLADAIAACARAVAVKPDFDNLGTLGLIYSTLAGYDAEHGVEPTPAFELGTRNLRAAIAIDDGEATVHYNLGRHWTRLAHYQTGHGEDPLRAVDDALVELAATVRLDAGRADGWAAMSEALIERARFQRAQHQEAQPTLERARAMLERALAVNPEILPPIRHRILLAELEAEAVLERHADPTSAVGRMRADAELLLRRRPGDGFGHRLLCRADLLAARWALAHRDAVERWLASATAEATHARETDPMDALAWIASAEVEQLRAQAARARGSAPNAAITRGRAFIERAMAIDPRLVRTRELRDELAR